MCPFWLGFIVHTSFPYVQNILKPFSPFVQMSRFVTSTPIKHDKENESAAQSSGLQQISPTYLSPVETEVKRPRLKDVNAYEVCSVTTTHYSCRSLCYVHDVNTVFFYLTDIKWE